MSKSKNKQSKQVDEAMQTLYKMRADPEHKDGTTLMEEQGDMWIHWRQNIPYLLKRFNKSPIDIWDILIMMDSRSSTVGRVWPSVTQMTGIPRWMWCEMIDAQYPDMPKQRIIAYNRPQICQARPVPVPQQDQINSQLLRAPLPLYPIIGNANKPYQNANNNNKRSHQKQAPSLSIRDLHKLNEILQKHYAMTPSHLTDLHSALETEQDYDPDDPDNIYMPPPTKAIPKEQEKLKEIYDEYSLMQMLPPHLIGRGINAPLLFDRVNPAIYCCVYAYILRMQKNLPIFILQPDSQAEINMALSGQHARYAQINKPRVKHWKNPRIETQLNDNCLCRLLRISPQTLSRWENGYLAPANIRIFFELFCEFPFEFVNLLIRIQNEIRDNLLIKLHAAFPHLLIEYPSSQCALEPSPLPDGPQIATQTLPNAAPTMPSPAIVASPLRKPRRWKGRIVSPPHSHIDLSGAYHPAPPVVRLRSQINITPVINSLYHPTEIEQYELNTISKIKLPYLVIKK